MIVSYTEQMATTKIHVSFLDEGVILECETTVKGDRKAAERYLSIFEADMRKNFAELFPVPEPDPVEEGSEE